MSRAAAGLDEDRLRALVAPVDFVRRLVVVATCGSTNDEVRALAASGAEPGTVVVAGEQTAGRGRLGRHWTSPPGAGLYLSVLVRPRGAVGHVTRWTLGAAVAGCEACRALSGAPVTIKWPNDLVAGGKKLAGILAELRVASGRQDLVIGLGVNVWNEPRDFPEAWRARTTSLAQIATIPGGLERGWARESLAAGYLEALGRIAGLLEGDGWSTVAAEWLARAPEADGARVRVVLRRDGRTVRRVGTTRGIDADGALRVEGPDGAVETIRTADSVEAL